MATGPGIGFAIALNGGILLLGLLAFGYWLKTNTDEPDPGEGTAGNWHQKTVLLIHEVKEVTAVSAPVVDPDRIQRTLLPLAYRIQSHVRTAPSNVDSRLLREFYDLGRECYAISMEHTELKALKSGYFLEEKLGAIHSDAEDIETTIKSESEPN